MTTTELVPRQALLIGVGRYQAETIPEITVAEHDVTRLGQALTDSSYKVKKMVTGMNTTEPTRNAIREAMQTALEEAPPGSTLIIYFTGHGARINGADYLCPSDTPAKFRQGSENDLIPADIGNATGSALDDTKAETVLFIVDACRDLATAGTKSLDTLAFSGVSKSTKRRTYTLYACRSGEVARYNKELGGSLMTVALTDALRPDTEPRTVGEVVNYIRKRMDELTLKYKLSPQVPTLCVEVEDEKYAERVICVGTNDTYSWNLYAEQVKSYVYSEKSDVWFGEKFEKLLSFVRRHVTKPHDLKDPWIESQSLQRYVKNLQLMQTWAQLNIVERIVVSTALLISEAALKQDGILPQFEIEKGVRGDYAGLVRRTKYLRGKKQISDAEAIDSWLEHQARRSATQLWQTEFIESLVKQVVELYESRTSRTQEQVEHLLNLAEGMTLGTPKILQDTKIQVHHEEVSEDLEVRLDRCFVVGRLAYFMNCDLKAFGEPLVHEIGLRSGFNLFESIEHLGDIRWTLDNEHKILSPDVTCAHPAADLFVRKVIAQMREFTLSQGAPSMLLSISENLVRPAIKDGRNTYNPPVPQISMDTNAVRELLVGRDLYGSPKVVIRELYQNALDACRYRQVREAYLDHVNPQRIAQSWKGSISFKLYRNDAGRLVLDCTDTGVGMSESEVSGAFTKAGRRFTDLPSFRAEQQRWEKVSPDLHLYPNSRFGIGVFSYFLLAEEVEVYTVRHNADGTVQSGIYLHLSSASGLVTQRPLQSDEPKLVNGGSLVRLIINETEWIELDDRLEGMIEELLGYAEFDLSVRENEDARSWPAGSFIGEVPATLSAYEGEGSKIWWTNNQAPVLADGVRLPVNTFGYLVNLGGPHRPKLDVSRNVVEHWNKDWVEKSVATTASLLHGWDRLNLSWLWQLSRSSTNLAQAVYNVLSPSEPNLLISEDSKSVAVPLSKVGVLPLDDLALDALAEHANAPSFVVGDLGRDIPSSLESAIEVWRKSIWWQLTAEYEVVRSAMEDDTSAETTLPPMGRCLVAPKSWTWPVPAPVDGRILEILNDNRVGYAGFIKDVKVELPELVRIAYAAELSLQQTVAILARYVIFGINIGSFFQIKAEFFRRRVAISDEAIVHDFTPAMGIDWCPWMSPAPSSERSNYRWLCHALAYSDSPIIDLHESAQQLGFSVLASWLQAAEEPPRSLIRSVRRQSEQRKSAKYRRKMTAHMSRSAFIANEDVDAWLDSLGLTEDEHSIQLSHRRTLEKLRAEASRTDLLIWSVDLDASFPWHSGSLNWPTVLLIASRSERSVHEVLEILGRWPEVSLPDDSHSDTDYKVSEIAARLISYAPVDGRERGLRSITFLAFLQSAYNHDMTPSQLLENLESDPLFDLMGIEKLWGSVPDVTRKILDIISVSYKSIRDTNVRWPIHLSVPETFNYAYLRKIDLKSAVEEIVFVTDFGITTTLDYDQVEYAIDYTSSASVIARALNDDWDLLLACALAVSRSRKDMLALLEDNAWWLQICTPDFSSTVSRVKSVVLPDDWHDGDEALGLVAIGNVASPADRVSILDMMTSSAMHGVSVGRVQAACRRLGQESDSVERFPSSYIPTAKDLSLMYIDSALEGVNCEVRLEVARECTGLSPNDIVGVSAWGGNFDEGDSVGL